MEPKPVTIDTRQNDSITTHGVRKIKGRYEYPMNAKWGDFFPPSPLLLVAMPQPANTILANTGKNFEVGETPNWRPYGVRMADARELLGMS